MEQTINQMVEIIQAGQPIGGMFKGEDKSEAVFYYIEGETLYAGVGQPHNGEAITEEELRRRLVGHFNAISPEEAIEDIAHIERMHQSIEAGGNPTAVAMTEEPAPTLVGPTITYAQAYSILQVLNEVHVYGDGLEEDHVELACYLYHQLPVHQQKDIEELELYIDIIE